MRFHRAASMIAGLVSAALLGAACAPMGDEGMQDMGGMDEMVMGDMADIRVAAQATVTALPPEPLGWVGYRMEQADADTETHAWGPAFLYSDDDARSVEVDGNEITLQAGDAVFVDEGVQHTAPDGDFWAFLLSDPEADPPPGLADARRMMSSGPLTGLPDGSADLRFLLVDLPPQAGQTTVHVHPGPEFIYVAQGQIEYETGLEETKELEMGDAAALPGQTPVQKRNVTDEPARFWSWFIVDPSEPFSSESMFGRG